MKNTKGSKAMEIITTGGCQETIRLAQVESAKLYSDDSGTEIEICMTSGNRIRTSRQTLLNVNGIKEKEDGSNAQEFMDAAKEYDADIISIYLGLQEAMETGRNAAGRWQARPEKHLTDINDTGIL